MITFKQFISDALDKAAKIEYLKNTDNEIDATSTINDRVIEFNAELMGRNSNPFWLVSFSENGKHSISGNGGEFEVFATAKKFILDLVAEKDPNVVTFRTEKLDGENFEKRGELYAKLSSKLRIPSYNLFIEKTPVGYFFVFTKKKPGEADDVKILDRRDFLKSLSDAESGT